MAGVGGMTWSEDTLRALPRQDGVRLRGLEMTRLETFTDAAFAFAATMLVISLSGIPDSVHDLKIALRGVPAFMASFATIAAFWHAHRRWSRRYGLEDGPATLLSLALIFVMLVYVYPLKMVFAAFFELVSGGRLPAGFSVDAGELPDLFIVYGIGFCALTGLIGLLYMRALKAADRLALDAVERIKTREEVSSFGVLAATGLVSALAAWKLPAGLGNWAGFIYATLGVSLPAMSARYRKRVERLDTGD